MTMPKADAEQQECGADEQGRGREPDAEEARPVGDEAERDQFGRAPPLGDPAVL